MIPNEDHDCYESPGSESSQGESSSDWESCFINRNRSTASYCKKSSRTQVNNAKRRRSAESISSDDSDDNTAPHPLRKRVKSCAGKTQNNRINSQKELHCMDKDLEPDESDGLDSEDTSETDPDIDTDDTISESEDDGYADTTKENVAGMCNLWERFCQKQHKKGGIDIHFQWANPNNALKVAGKTEFTRFLRWRLKVRRGKKGRQAKGVKKASTLDTNWKNFLRHYEKVNKEPMDGSLARRMRKSIRKIVRQAGLDTEEKEKTPMFIEDLVPLQETVLRTMEKRFYSGLQRMQQCLYNLMACFTVNRINAMRNLQYKHILCSIQRDPKGGPPRILLEFTYKFTKKYLKITQGNIFPIPEIIYDPSLMLSPHTFLLGILFHDDAFLAPGIRSMGDLRRLFLEGDRQQMEIPLKPEKAENYVFCKIEGIKGLIKCHRDQPISKSSLSSQFQTFGEITGFKWSLFTHRFRYGGGTILNQSGLVSDAQQNLIMKHNDIRTFLNHYLPRHIGTDMQSLMRGLEPDSAMMRAVTRMGRWIDTRRPRELTDEQKARVEEEVELKEAIEKRDVFSRKLHQGNRRSAKQLERLDQLKKNVTNTRNRLLYDLRKRVREEFDSRQAVIDIERQLAGSALYENEKKEVLLTEEHMLPEQILLLEKLTTWPTSLSLEAEWTRRNEAVEAVRMYCDVFEGGPRRGRRYAKPEIFRHSTKIRNASFHTARRATSLPAEEENSSAEAPTRENKKPLGCFQCYGMKHYSRHKHLLRHFRDSHLNDRHCNQCNETVEHEMGLRRHMHEKHGLKT